LKNFFSMYIGRRQICNMLTISGVRFDGGTAVPINTQSDFWLRDVMNLLKKNVFTEVANIAGIFILHCLLIKFQE